MKGTHLAVLLIVLVAVALGIYVLYVVVPTIPFPDNAYIAILTLVFISISLATMLNIFFRTMIR